MNESRLTLRELRILRETERSLCEDEDFAVRFEELGDPPRKVRGRRRLWLFAGLVLLLTPVLMVLHPAVGVLGFASVLSVGTALWIGRRREDRGPFGRGSGP